MSVVGGGVGLWRGIVVIGVGPWRSVAGGVGPWRSQEEEEGLVCKLPSCNPDYIGLAM